jgi:ABC-type spermidine/putrescine transport system permease subunit II
MSRRREWWALAVLGIAAIVVSLVLFAPRPAAHASSVRAKTWGVSMFMCDNGISTDWYRTQRAALHEYSLDITSHYSLATRLLHYRNGRNHLVIEWDTPHHCRGAR